MRKCSAFTALPRAAALALALVLCLAPALPALAEEVPAGDAAAAEPAEPAATAEPDSASGGETTVYVGEIATHMEEKWECPVSFPVKSDAPKSYETMVGNILRLTVYSTVPQDIESNFCVPQDSHIAYVDGSDRFTMTGKSGEYYCYEKSLRVTGAGSFDLAVANTNNTLYSGLYDTISITAYDSIDTIGFFAEEDVADPSVTTFLVTANGSSTTLITPDTIGFNASDNEWKIITAEKSEKVLFADTTYKGYRFDPQTISLRIMADESARADPTPIQIYYLGLVNGKLFTVGPYTYPASDTTYSSTFELAEGSMDVLATENTATFYAYVETGRTPDITLTDADGVASLNKLETVESDRENLDKLAITVNLNDTARDIDLLVGNRWGTSQIAYNYRTLHISFLRDIQSLSVTATQDGHYLVSYAATVNGQQKLDTTAVNWYINGAVQPEHGLTLVRDYNQGGHYAVYAELNGLTSNTVESSIIYTAWQAAIWYIVMIAVVALAIFMLLRYARTRGARMDTHLRSEMLALTERVEQLQVRLTRGEITAGAALTTMSHMEPRLLMLGGDLQERYRATNVEAYKQATQLINKAAGAIRAGGRNNKDAYYASAVLSTARASLHQALETLQDIASLAVK